jgi:hypothetical protein
MPPQSRHLAPRDVSRVGNRHNLRRKPQFKHQATEQSAFLSRSERATHQSKRANANHSITSSSASVIAGSNNVFCTNEVGSKTFSASS